MSLAGVLAMEVGWLAAIHLQPLLARRLENTATTPVLATQTHASTRLVASANGLDYKVPAATYSLGIDISNPCWVVVRQLGSGATLLAATLEPGNGVRFVPVSGDASVEISARANAITVSDGPKTLGTIKNPTVGVTYDFTSRPISAPEADGPS